jgi:hypothetical protein
VCVCACVCICVCISALPYLLGRGCRGGRRALDGTESSMNWTGLNWLSSSGYNRVSSPQHKVLSSFFTHDTYTVRGGTLRPQIGMLFKVPKCGPLVLKGKAITVLMVAAWTPLFAARTANQIPCLRSGVITVSRDCCKRIRVKGPRGWPGMHINTPYLYKKHHIRL